MWRVTAPVCADRTGGATAPTTDRIVCGACVARAQTLLRLQLLSSLVDAVRSDGTVEALLAALPEMQALAAD